MRNFQNARKHRISIHSVNAISQVEYSTVYEQYMSLRLIKLNLLINHSYLP